MSVLKRFQDFVAKEHLFYPTEKLLLAVSGGLDSVVLSTLCKRIGYEFIIAHGNFQLRGPESERDEYFVRRLAEQLHKEVVVKRFDTENYARENRLSIQMAARELRYDWFQELASGPGACRWIVTAHHMDDNIETVLMNFFKGTGIAGLRGILPKQEKIVRPLLFAKKEELAKFAHANNLQWVEDSSNLQNKYSRNYFRHQIIPLIEKIYPDAINNLGDNLERFRALELLYQQSIARHKKNLLEVRGNEVHIPVLKLKKTEPMPTVLYEILKDFSFSSALAEEVLTLMSSETGRYVSSRTHRVIKNRNWLIIAPHENNLSSIVVMDKPHGMYAFDLGTLTLEQGTVTALASLPNVAQVDASLVQFPLLLRKWKEGDYFYPLGMKKKKKLARFFIDKKLSKTEKEKIWVIEMNKKIVWVIGQRIDERFKITPATTEQLRMELKKTVHV